MPAARNSDARDVVIIVHGILVGPWIMRTLERRLQAAGYRTINWGYPSVLRSNRDHGRMLLSLLHALDHDPLIERIHLVTHSMGGIVARSALAQGRPEKLGRVVMLNPPNHGSWAATLVGPAARMIGWRTVGELSQRSWSYVNRLPGVDGIEVGVIAGRLDYLVSVASTHLDGQRDHLVVTAIHSTPIFRGDVFRQIVAFLSEGRFRRSRPTDPAPALAAAMGHR